MIQLISLRQWLVIAVATSLISGVAEAKITFLGLSAGDMTAESAVLWVRVNHPKLSAATVEIAKDPSFKAIVTSQQGTVNPDNNGTLKLKVSGLQSNTKYYYHFKSGSLTSWVGSFYTNPGPTENTKFKIAFTGDADQKYRPYPAIEYFGNTLNVGSTELNAFIFLGDTIYETSATGLPGFGKVSQGSVNTAIPSGSASPSEAANALLILNKRYDANIKGVAATGAAESRPVTGLNGVRSLLSSTGIYTLLDNHEIFGALQSGGAPINAVKENSNPSYATNPSGPYNNDTIAFLAETKAFYNNMPTAVDIVGKIDAAKGTAEHFGLSFANLLAPEAPVDRSTDPRSSGKPVNYFSRRWGKNIYYIQVDDRTYRDARMVAPARYALTPATFPLQEAKFDASGQLDRSQAYESGFQKGDPKPGVYMAANQAPGRTMLGTTQLEWLLAELNNAKTSQALWTVIAVSTPIDQRGSLTDSKSWAGGYPGERNQIFKKIADLSLHNVVFLTTDDHNARINRLKYQPDPANDANWANLPYAFQVLAGPMGAVGPDQPPFHVTETLAKDYSTVISDLIQKDNDLAAFQQPTIGLVGYPGMSNISRIFDSTSATAPQSVDFYNPDTFGYTTLEWDEAAMLTISYWGIKAYSANQYPKNYKKPQKILSFSVTPSP